MSGLVGAVGTGDVLPVIMGGLRRLENRNYDSAGIAALDRESRRLRVFRTLGAVEDLGAELRRDGLASPLAIGHMRSATHGRADARNAHPHVSQGDVAVVHKGVIENHAALRRMLEGKGYEFSSDTDTEVIAHLIHLCAMSRRSLFEAVQAAVSRLSGLYSFAAVSASEADALVVVRQGSPLVIGVGERDGQQFVASDIGALLTWTRHFVHPENGDVVLLKHDDVSIVDVHGRIIVRPLRSAETPESVGVSALPQPALL